MAGVGVFFGWILVGVQGDWHAVWDFDFGRTGLFWRFEDRVWCEIHFYRAGPGPVFDEGGRADGVLRWCWRRGGCEKRDCCEGDSHGTPRVRSAARLTARALLRDDVGC